MRPGCTCERERLCDTCLEVSYGQLAGVAMRRGDVWAERVIRDGRDRRLPWWPHEGAARARARAIVAELGRDDRLIERLAAACAAQAAKRWAQP